MKFLLKLFISLFILASITPALADPRALLREGDVMDAADTTLFELGERTGISYARSQSGALLISVRLSRGGSVDTWQSLLLLEPNGTRRIVYDAQSPILDSAGTPVPGTKLDTVTKLHPIANGEWIIEGGTAGWPGFSQSRRTILHLSAQGLKSIFREGDQSLHPSGLGYTIQELQIAPDSTVNTVAVLLVFGNSPRGIYSYDRTGYHLFALGGAPAPTPGEVFNSGSTLSFPFSLSANGRISFIAVTKPANANIPSQERAFTTLASSPYQPQLVASTGDPVPGAPQETFLLRPGPTLTFTTRIVQARGDNEVILFSLVALPGTQTRSSGLWSWRPGSGTGQFQTISRCDESARGMPAGYRCALPQLRWVWGSPYKEGFKVLPNGTIAYWAGFEPLRILPTPPPAQGYLVAQEEGSAWRNSVIFSTRDPIPAPLEGHTWVSTADADSEGYHTWEVSDLSESIMSRKAFSAEGQWSGLFAATASRLIPVCGKNPVIPGLSDFALSYCDMSARDILPNGDLLVSASLSNLGGSRTALLKQRGAEFSVLLATQSPLTLSTGEQLVPRSLVPVPDFLPGRDDAILLLQREDTLRHILISLPLVAVCPADFNSDGAATVQDIFDFLSLWFVQDSGADFNRDNTVTVQDLFDFLEVWFGGCP